MHRVPGARGCRPAVRAAMRVLLTGAAGFIGSRVATALTDDGHDVVAVDAMLPAAHGDNAEPPEGVQRVDVRDAGAVASLLDGVDVVCHQAAVVGRRGGRRRCAVLRQPQRLRDVCTARGDVRRGLPSAGARIVDGGLRPGQVQLRRARRRRPAAADTRRPGRRGVRAPLPASAANSWIGSWSTRTPRCGREACTRRASSRRSTMRWHGRSRRAARWSRCGTTTSTGRTCRATPRTPGSRRSSGRSSKRAMCRGFTRTAGRCATSFTSTTSPPPTFSAVNANLRRLQSGQCVFGQADLDPRGRDRVVRGARGCDAGGDGPVPQRRRPPHRGQPGGCAELLRFNAAVDPRDGLREFAYAPLRG